MSVKAVLLILAVLIVIGLWVWLFIRRKKVWVKIVEVKDDMSQKRDKLDYVWGLFEQNRRVGYPEILYDAFYSGREIYLPGSYCPPKREESIKRSVEATKGKLRWVLTGKIVRFLISVILPIYPVNLKSRLKKLEDLSASLSRTLSGVKSLYWSSLYLTHEQEISRGYRIDHGLHRQIEKRIAFKRRVLNNYLRESSIWVDSVVERQQQGTSDLKKAGLDPAFYTNGSKKWKKRLAEIREVVKNGLDLSADIVESFIGIYNYSDEKMSEFISDGGLFGKAVEKIRYIKGLYVQVQETLRYQSTCVYEWLDTPGVLTKPNHLGNLEKEIRVDELLLKWSKEGQLNANLGKLSSLKLGKFEKDLMFKLQEDEKSFEEEDIQNRIKAKSLMLDWQELDDEEFVETLLVELFDLERLQAMDSGVIKALQEIVGFSDLIRENIERIRFLSDEVWEILGLLVEENAVQEAAEKTHPFLHFFGYKEFKFGSNGDDDVLVAHTRIEAAALQIREMAHILNSQQKRLKKVQSVLGAPKEVFPEFDEVKDTLLNETTKLWANLDPTGLNESLEHVREKLETIVEKSQTLEGWAETILYFRHKLEWLEEKEVRADEVYKISLGDREQWYKNQRILISVMVKHWADFDNLKYEGLQTLQTQKFDQFQIQLQNDEGEIRRRMDFRQEQLATRVLERLQKVRFETDVTEKTRQKILDFHNSVQNDPEKKERTMLRGLGLTGTVSGVPEKIEFGLIERDFLLNHFEDAERRSQKSKMSLGDRVKASSSMYNYEEESEEEKAGFDIRTVFAKGR